MRGRLRLLGAAALMGLAPLAGIAPPGAHAASGSPVHVFEILLENQPYEAVFGPGGSTAAPYLNSLTAQGVRLDRSYGIGHASLPNYIALISGYQQNPNTSNDCFVYNCVYQPGADSNLADQLEAAGLSWKGYMDSMPAPCTHGVEQLPDPFQSPYADRHNPFNYFEDIVGPAASSRCQAHVVPYTQLSADMSSGSVPNFSFITPDTCHDGHDQPCFPPYTDNPGGLPEADHWLSQNLPPILAYANAHFGVVIVTFDEGEGATASQGCCSTDFTSTGAGGGHIATVVLGPFVRHGAVSTVPYNHHSVLLTVEDIFRLSCLRHACDPGVTPFGTDIWAVPAAPQ